MTRKRKPGRPRVNGSSRRDAVVYVRLTDTERAAVDVAAAQAQRSVGDWARLALVAASKT